MFDKIKNRDGLIVEFQANKITNSIQKAGEATGEFEVREAEKLTLKVLTLARDLRLAPIPLVEEIQDIAERVLLDSPFYKTAKAFIIYRELHKPYDGVWNCSYCQKEDDTVTKVRLGSSVRVCFECKEKLSLTFDKGEIIKRSISFEPEHKQAGISILSYFSEIIQQKYPSIDAKVNIEQSGKTVTMIVETPDGEVNKVQKVLDEYGLVIKGDMLPEKLLDNPNYILRLEHKLDMANLEIKYTKKLLDSQDKQYAGRIQGLEDEAQNLRLILGAGLQRNYDTINHFLNLLEAKIKNDTSFTNNLIEVLKENIQKIPDKAIKKDIQQVIPMDCNSEEDFIEKIRNAIFVNPLSVAASQKLLELFNNIF